MTQLVFIVSLPRSGSTLLQKMLSVSPEVASTAEPWIMLPFWGMRNPSAGRAVYFHHTAAAAINDFIGQIPDGEEVFLEAARRFATSLYEAAARGRPYFLDKTPRYHLMLPLLRRIFPNARYILLTRNPLAVLASMAETFYHGRFLWSDYWIDWLEGHRALAEAAVSADRNLHVVRYESLVTRPGQEMEELCAWLGLPFLEEMVSAYHDAELPGRMGDPKGVRQYGGVSTAPLDKWQSFFGSPFRRRVAMAMLRRVGGETLERLGYPLAELTAGLKRSSMDRGFDLSGRYDYLVNLLAHAGDYRYLQARVRAWRTGAKYAYGFYRHV